MSLVSHHLTQPCHVLQELRFVAGRVSTENAGVTHLTALHRQHEFKQNGMYDASYLLCVQKLSENVASGGLGRA